MSLNGARLRYVDEDGKEVVVPAKGRTFEIGSYCSCDLTLEPQAERLVCEIKCDAFGRVTIHNKSTKETAIHLNDKIIHGQRGHPLLHGNRITILDRVYTWESYKMSGTEDVPSTPERLSPVEQAPNSCPLTKSHRPQIDKRLTVHNFRYSINSDDEGNTSIESRDQNESHLDKEESLNLSAPPSTELSSCETPKVDLVEATQNKENTATPSSSHRQLLQLCALSDVVITSFSPRETGVKVEKSFTCIRKPTKFGKHLSASAASVSMSTPKSVYSTPKGGGVLSELNDDSCSRDLLDFSTPSTSKKTNRQSSMYLIDLTTPSRLRPSSVKQMPTPISVDSTDESSDGSPFVIDITKSPTPTTPSRSQLTKTPRRPAAAATPTRTPQSLMKRALLTSTKKKHIAKQIDKTPVSTTNRPSLLEKHRLCRTTPRLPFRSFPTPEQIEAQRAEDQEKRQARNTSPRKRLSLHPATPRDNKLSQLRKSLAAAKRSPTVDLGIRLTAKARRTLNSPKSGSPKAELSSSKPSSPAMRKTINVSQPKCSTPKKLDESNEDELSRTFTIMNESGEPAEEASALGIKSALVTGEIDAKTLETSLPIKEIKEHSPSKNTETELKSTVKNVNQDDSKLDANGTKSLDKSCREPDHLDPYSSIQANDIIEDNICEEVHANIPKPLDDDDIDICEKELPDIKSSEEENKEPSSGVETPKMRRSLRRLSVEQKTVVAATTPRRTRRDSVEASSSKAKPKTEGSRRASCSALENIQEVSGTPRRKRRFSEQMCTPTRQSKRLMTPKQTLQMDNSIDDMGVIVEEDDGEIQSKRLITPKQTLQMDNSIDDMGQIVEEVEGEIQSKRLITPKRTHQMDNSIDDMGQIVEEDEGEIQSKRLMTPKPTLQIDDSVDDMGLIVEEVDGEIQSKRLMTPKQTPEMDNSIDDMGLIVEEVDDAKSAIVEDENYGKEVPCDEPDNVDYHGLRDLFRPPKSCSTPHFKGLREMMRTPKVPASPIFGNIEELLENSSSSSITVGRVATENSKALDSILKTPSARNIMVPNEPASAVLKSRDNSLAPTTEYDLDMTNATLHLDQIFDDVPSTSVAHMEDTETEINVTALSTASGLDPLKESVSSEVPMNVCKSLASHRKDPLTSTTYKTAMQGDLELSISFAEECDATSRRSSLGSNEMSGIRLLDQTSDSMFSEPLIVSGVDSCDVTVEETGALGQTTYQPLEINEVDTDSNIGLAEPLVLSDDEAEVVTPKKSAAPNEVSIAYKLEETIASKDFTPNQSQSKQTVAGETKARKTDSLIEEVSLIEVDESVADDSINATTDEKSLVIELDSSSDTNESPAKEDNVSAAAELTIVESETFPLDATEDSIALVEEPASGDRKAVESESAIAEVVTEIPTDYSDPLPAEEEVLEKSRTTDVGLTDEVSAAVDSDSPADNSVNVEEGPLASGDPKPIDSESSISKENSTGQTPEEDQSVIDALPSEEVVTDKLPTEAKSSAAAGTDDTTVESLGEDVEPIPIESISLIAKPAEVSLVEDNKSEKGDNENDESLGRDESISTVTKPEAGEVSVSSDPKAEGEPRTSEVSLVEAEEAKGDDLKNDETAEKPETEPEQSILKVPSVDAKEIQKGDVEELPEKPTPNIHDIEVVPASEESALAGTASSSPSPVIIKEDKTTAVQDTVPIQPAADVPEESSIVMIQESNITETETEILQEKNTCDEQQTNGDEAKAKETTINQLLMSESAAPTAAEKSPLQGMDLPQELDSADLTASNQQEDLAVTEVKEDEIDVNIKDVIPGESTSLEITEIESCGQEAVSPKVLPSADIIADKENSQNTSSITEEQTPASKEEENKGCPPKNGPDQIESKVEVIQLGDSSIAEEIGEDSIIAETPRDQSLVNDLEVVAVNEKIAAQEVQAKPTEECPILLKESNQVKVICIDSSSEDSLEGKAGNINPPVTAEASLTHNSESAQDDDEEQPGEATTEDIFPDESITDVLESSATLEASSSAPVQKRDPEILPTEAPNSSKAVDDEIPHIDAAQEASATHEPLIAKIKEDATTTLSADDSLRDAESAKIKPQGDKPSSTPAESEDKPLDPTATEMQQSVKALQMNSLASPETKLVVLDALISDINNISQPNIKTDHLSIEDEAKDTEKNQAVSEDEVMSDALIEETAHASDSNTKIEQQPQSQPDDLLTDAKSPPEKAMQTTTGKEVSDVIELSDDSNSESSSVKGTPVGEDGNTVTGVSASEASVPIQETPPSEDPKERKVDDVPKEENNTVTGSASEKAMQTTTDKEVSDVIELSEDSNSKSSSVEGTSVGEPIKDTPPSEDPKERKVDDVPEEDRNTVTGSASEASVPIQEAPPSEDPKERKVDDVPEEDHSTVTGSASDMAMQTTTGQEVSDVIELSEDSNSKSSSVEGTSVGEPIKDTTPSEDPKEMKADDVPGEGRNPVTSETSNASMETLKTEDPKAGKVDVVPEDLSCELHVVTESAAPAPENVESSGDSEHVDDQKASNSETIHSEKLVSCESGISEKSNEPSLEASVSIEPSQIVSKPLSHEKETSEKEHIKPVKRATRKGSVSVERPAEDIMERPSRRARKPSADVEDVHEKPKRRVLRKASAEVAEPMTDIQKIEETKEEEVLKVIPEEAHSSKPNEDGEQQKEADIHQPQENVAIEKPKRRARKPSEEVKSADPTEKPKRRARKPSAEVAEPVQKKKESDEEPNKEEQPHTSKINKHNELQEEADSSSQKQDKGEELKKSEETKQEETLKSHANIPKRRGRTASREETETKAVKKPKMDDILDVIEEKETPSSNQVEEQQEKPKRRGRKASAEEEANNVVKLPTSDEVLQSIVEEANEPKANEESEVNKEGRSRRRARKPSTEGVVVENTAAGQPKESPNGIPSYGLTSPDNPLASVPEDQPTVPKQTRKSSEFVPAEMHESTKDTDHIERPKRRARKPTGDSEQGAQDVPNKTRRRGKTPADPEKQPSAEAMENEPVKKTKRTARKPSVEIVDAVVHNTEVEHLVSIEEAVKPDPEAEAATSKQEEKVETKTRRGGRNLKPETQKNTAEEGHSRRRGRKVNEEEAPKSEDPAEAKTSLEEAKTSLEEEPPKELPPNSNNEVQELPVAVVTAPEKKTTRRVLRKASANVDERAPAAIKTATRRGIKEGIQDDDDVQEKQIDLQQVPTESVPAVVVMSGEAEDELTPRRREGRNMPRKNYDETSDEDKQRSARRARKPAANKALAFKPPEEDVTPEVKDQPVEELDTSVADTPVIPEPTTSQRREGRNVPRKNYTEAPDDEKPSTSRVRRVRNLTAKGLELIVDSTPRPNTPKSRKGKAGGKEDAAAKRLSLEAVPPPTEAESGADEEPAPVIAKGRAVRRKADNDESGAAPPSKRGARGQHEESEQPEGKSAKKNVRATGRKAKAETETDEPAPTKKARGGRAKTPVKPPEETSATDPEEHPAPSIKKGRGKARAKTPAKVTPGDTATEPEDEPAKKPAARSRARGAKAAAVAESVSEQPAQDSEAEPASSSVTPSRGGSAKKVHFEPTQTAETAAADAEKAPKRATRSRRK